MSICRETFSIPEDRNFGEPEFLLPFSPGHRSRFILAAGGGLKGKKLASPKTGLDLRALQFSFPDCLVSGEGRRSAGRNCLRWSLGMRGRDGRCGAISARGKKNLAFFDRD